MLFIIHHHQNHAGKICMIYMVVLIGAWNWKIRAHWTHLQVGPQFIILHAILVCCVAF